MKKIYFLCLAIIAMIGCRSAPFKVETLAIKEPTKIEKPDQGLGRDFRGLLSEGLSARYKRAKSPSFALINGYYKLPRTRPFGAATVVRSYSYNTSFEMIRTDHNRQQAYAIEPIPADDALALNQALNSLLDMGVKIKEIAMSDALLVAKAESEAERSGKAISFSSVLPTDVDYLMSIYPSEGSRGPVMVGRVIKKDGTLVAFRVMEGRSQYVLGALIGSLFEDTINRI